MYISTLKELVNARRIINWRTTISRRERERERGEREGGGERKIEDQRGREEGELNNLNEKTREWGEKWGKSEERGKGEEAEEKKKGGHEDQIETGGKEREANENTPDWELTTDTATTSLQAWGL